MFSAPDITSALALKYNTKKCPTRFPSPQLCIHCSINYQDPPAAGTELCMPQQCDIYTVKKNDTCQSIAASQPGYITVTQLQAWDPNLYVLCTNMAQQENMQICVRYSTDHHCGW